MRTLALVCAIVGAAFLVAGCSGARGQVYDSVGIAPIERVEAAEEDILAVREEAEQTDAAFLGAIDSAPDDADARTVLRTAAQARVASSGQFQAVAASRPSGWSTSAGAAGIGALLMGLVMAWIKGRRKPDAAPTPA